MTDHTQQARTASIPDTAIEAAAKGIARVGDERWERIPQHTKDTHLLNARLALTAAAPYMGVSE